MTAVAPGANNQGRFQYTGQMWLNEAGLYHYKARLYDPGLGRFLQTDPIGYADGLNLYAYVGGDPVNATDPSGLIDEVVVSGTRRHNDSIGNFGGLSNGAIRGGADRPGEGGGGKSIADQTRAAVDKALCGSGAQGYSTQPWTTPAAGAISNIAPGGVGAARILGAAKLASGVGAFAATLFGSTSTNADLYIPLYRAVGSAELANIYSTTPAQFSMSPSGFGQKQFWLSANDARWYASSTSRWDESCSRYCRDQRAANHS